jgi:hypothetical protein
MVSWIVEPPRLEPGESCLDGHSAFAGLREWRADGLLVGSDPFLADWSEKLAALDHRQTLADSPITQS